MACPRKTSRDGKFHEILGTYNPIPDPHGNKQVTLKIDRIKYWMTVGAEPSERVSKLLGIAEVLPPAPRRALPKASVDVLFPPVEEVEDAASEDDDAGSVEAADDAADNGSATSEDSSSSSSDTAPEQKPS